MIEIILLEKHKKRKKEAISFFSSDAVQTNKKPKNVCQFYNFIPTSISIACIYDQKNLFFFLLAFSIYTAVNSKTFYILNLNRPQKSPALTKETLMNFFDNLGQEVFAWTE